MGLNVAIFFFFKKGKKNKRETCGEQSNSILLHSECMYVTMCVHVCVVFVLFVCLSIVCVCGSNGWKSFHILEVKKNTFYPMYEVITRVQLL